MQILSDLSGKARPGQLLALMGPSGAGKTTLLNCLSGRNTKCTGEVLLNGKPWDSSLRRVAAYIQQDDVLPAHLTPMEHLSVVAKLRMDHGVSKEERDAAVNEAIDMLGLRKCADTVIGDPGLERGISGGERKRVSVACEVLMDPSIIFCDEPTTGLDSFMAEQVIAQLKTLACDPRRPRTIIATIHQPSSQAFQMFDRLLLVAGGRTAFLGPSSGAVSYFERFGADCCCPKTLNPADFFLSLLSPQQNAEIVEMVCEQYISYEEFVGVGSPEAENAAASAPGVEALDYTEQEVNFKSAYASRWYTQIGTLCQRAWMIKRRNPQEVRVQIMMALFFSTVIGFLYFDVGNDQSSVQNINGLHFLMMMQVAMQQIVPALTVFAVDMPLYMREHRAGMYSMSALFISRNLVDLPMQLSLGLFFGTIIYWLAGLPAVTSTFFGLLLVLVIHAYTAASFGYLVGALAPNANVARMCMPLVLMPQILLAGLMINIESIPVFLNWIQYVSFFRYSYEALMVNIWGDWGPIGCSGGMNGRCPYKAGKAVLSLLSFEDDSYHKNIAIVAGIGVLVRGLAWMFLCRRARSYVTADS